MKQRNIQSTGRAIICQAAAGLLCAATASAATATNPLELYNQGVNKLAAKELKEAEVALRSAVESNHEQLQPAALYNLGHVRFLQGQEILKDKGNRQQLLDSSAAITALAAEVVRRITPIAESDDLRELINAYMEARGTRKQLRLVHNENTRQLDLLGSALARWRRSVGDFHSAVELEPSNKDAAFNADVVERHIAELIKFKKKLEQEQENVGQQRDKLKELMKKMRGKIPKGMQQGSDEEEDDEDEEEPQEKGEKEKQTGKQQQQRIGGEREIDPDMLRVLKEMIKPRTMSVGQEGEGEKQGFRPGPDQIPGGGDREKKGFGPGGTEKPNEPKGKKGRDW